MIPFNLIPLKFLILAGVWGVSSFYVYHAGNTYGSYARAYKAVVAELAAKNAELAVQKKEDAAEIASLEKAREAATAGAKDLKTCKVTKDQAKRINAVRE